MRGKRTLLSVLVLCYQQRGYLGQCIQSILQQKTTFPFEVLIHDDASQDGSAELLRRMAAAWNATAAGRTRPIRLFLEAENQYSRGVNIVQEILLPAARGEYVAFLEGDDYWCDAEKLELQYRYLKRHPECALCVHETLRLPARREGGRFFRRIWERNSNMFGGFGGIHALTEEEIYLAWRCHTSSYFLRRKDAVLPDWAGSYWCGDYVFLVVLSEKGAVVCLPYCCSVYRTGVTAGVTKSGRGRGVAPGCVDREWYRLAFLQRWNRETRFRHAAVIKERWRQANIARNSQPDTPLTTGLSYCQERGKGTDTSGKG